MRVTPAPVVEAAPVQARRRFRVRGVVQGVGFRPFVYRLAVGLGLAGHVRNDADGVLVEVEGDASVLAAFADRLVGEHPPLARIDVVDTEGMAVLGEAGFRIGETDPASGARTLVPPDVAVCGDCLRELFDPHDRRYRYPFINCTNCGPRFTIIQRLPYDRANTTMRGFSLCLECTDDYHDPGDRRFHAEPLACAACGPRLRFETARDTIDGNDAAITEAQRALERGEIVAVKGVGGYHLACDARSTAAVARLRDRKRRPEKPFAVMVHDLARAAALCDLNAAEAELLCSPQRPIVLLRRQGDGVTPLVAPGNPILGVLLAYAPLHHLLFHPVPSSDAPVPDALVMTSGNRSDEPICFDDTDARDRLAHIADAWLVHDRPIHVPCDDSVLRVVDGAEVPIRRSRGAAPVPVRLPFDAPPVLAVGGELKNAFCLASGRAAWMSQHIGDMGGVESLAAFVRATEQFARMYGVAPELVAADAHPGYQTRRWAEDRTPKPVELVQHHHAHVASVMVEHLVPGDRDVIGFAFDGTGFGTDGAVWGGEVLVARYSGFERTCHLRYVRLPGGDASIRNPRRAALAHLWAAGVDWSLDLPPVRAASPDERSVLARQLHRGIHCVETSSMGRLFDAVSSLLGLRHAVSFEAQAAMELESIAAAWSGATPAYHFELTGDEIVGASVVHSIVADLRRGEPTGAIAAGLHHAVAELVGSVADRIRARTGIEQVVLSGGVFQNALLLHEARTHLVARGFEVLTHRIVPPNDGGLALGQVAVASHRGRGAGA